MAHPPRKGEKPKGRWITTDEGHHVFISSKGELLIHGPGGPSRGAPGRGTPDRLAEARAIRGQRADAARILGTQQGVRGRGDIKLYHGTSIHNVAGIRSEGLRNFNGQGYSMLSTHKGTALDAANAKGAGVVLEYRIPGRDAAKYIERGGRATGIRGKTDVYAAVKPANPLPGEYLRGAQVPAGTIKAVGKDKVAAILRKHKS